MTTSTMPALIPYKKAAELCHRSRHTIYMWRRKGLIEVAYLPSGLPLVVADSLVKKERAAKPAPAPSLKKKPARKRKTSKR
jgi:hypothetical protein